MLYLVPTPIGNLDDITLRAIKLFQKAEFILTEDGRQTSQLLNLLQIHNRPKFINLLRHHQFNQAEIEPILHLIQESNKESPPTVLLVTDSGTPGISDPAVEVVRLAQKLNIPYSTLPGPTALVPAIVNSGLITKEFAFLGFLPIKNGRQKVWKNIISSSQPVVIYESVHRLDKFLAEVQKYLEPDRKISFSREVSKIHEEIWTGTVADLAKKEITPKGEFVWVIG